jgi:predicted transcriptional regulator YdeE
MLKTRSVKRGSFTIAGVTTAGQAGEINYADVWQKQYGPMDAQLKPLSSDDGRYGASFYEGDHIIYIAGVAVADLTELPAGIEKHELPAAEYAVFECTLANMEATVQEAYGQWFNSSDVEPDHSAVGFEYYPPYSGSGEMRVEVYIPVKNKEAAAAISEGSTMSVFEAVANRRSIRKFKSDVMPEEALRRILQAGILAPSGMNRQPWKLYVVQGEKRAEMTARLMEGLANREKEGKNTGGARHSFEVMAQAPVTVFIFRPGQAAVWPEEVMPRYSTDVVDVQSVGAAIENMLLAAQELGVGSLWVCDVFSAGEELSNWLGEPS